MPDHLRALVAILVLSVPAFMLARLPACATALQVADFIRRRNLWFALTLAAFLAHNFWLFLLVAGCMLAVAKRKETNILGLYLFVMLAVPAVAKEVPGFGLANYLVALDYPRLLALVLLLPAFLKLKKQPGVAPLGRLATDKLLLGYLIVKFVLMLEYSPLTTALRNGVFVAFVDVFLPYYVASRSLRTLRDFRDALMSFAVAAMIVSPVLFFEFAKGWLLYASVDEPLGARWGWSNYLVRDGNLRASGAVGHAIAAGYVMAVALGFYVYLRKAVPGRAAWLLGLLILLAGLFGPLSRGPWIGAATMMLVFVLTGRRPFLGIARLALLGIIVLPLLLASPLGDRVVDYLPFVGTVDSQNVTGRQRLAEVAIQLFLQSPLFGMPNFLDTPAMEALRGPDGIIDVVNTYVIVGLNTGIFGLVTFVGFFLAAGIAVWTSMRKIADRGDERYVLGQALIAVLAGILLMIATVSPVLHIPTLYWLVGGLSVGYSQLLAARGAPAAAPASAPPARADLRATFR